MFLKIYWKCAPIFGLTYAAVYRGITELKTSAFDFIVIGGGTAGAVVANRLTERPDFNVLLIEAGPTNEGVLNAIVPALYVKLTNTVYDWNYTTAPQIGINNMSLPYGRAHILGGCSSHNAMFYTRGSSEEYDRMAAVTGDSGWSWKNMLPYLVKSEKWSPPADNHDTEGQFNPSVHSTKGVLFTSLPGFPTPIDDMVLTVPKQLPMEFPFIEDMNAGKPLGLGWTQTTIGNGERSSAATAFLSSKFTSRSNLHVLLNTKVTRVLSSTKTLKFDQVEISGHPGMPLTAKKELILSAGTINTPQILLNSGIGDSRELEPLGIPCVLNITSVGKNLADQPATSLVFSVNSNNTLDDFQNSDTLQAEALARWQQNRTGQDVSISFNQILWARLPSSSPVIKQFGDPSAGPNTPHFELDPLSGGGPFPGHYIQMVIVLAAAASRGTVSLNTTDRYGQPIIDLGLYSSPFDLPAVREAIHISQRFFQAPIWKGYINEQISPPPNVTSDADLDAYIRSHTFANLHSVGTASMSHKGATNGVVDPDLRVKGAQGLRVVDASVIPFVPAAHTQAPIYAVAERASDLIKNFWRE